jgi:hypothetical protein
VLFAVMLFFRVIPVPPPAIVAPKPTGSLARPR